MTSLLTLPVLGLLFGAALSLVFRRLAAQRAISFASLALALVCATTVFVRVWVDGEVQVARMGGWPGSFAITFVADRLSAVMLLVALAAVALVLLYAIGQRAPDERSSFYHPAYMVMCAGIAQALLAGDLFNLFVAFEILLMASYVLLTLEGTNEQIRAGTTYVVLNILESLILLMAIGFVFAATGTVNMAELPERLAELPDGVRTGLQLFLLIAFGIKAAVFPLFFWLPDSYPTAPSSVSAVFAGLLTKVGVYCMIRTQTLLFPGEASDLIVVVGILTMVIGIIGAVSHQDMKRILSFHIISQIGYMVFGLGVGGEAAIAATVFFLVHQIPVKTSLFLVEGIVSRDQGSSSLKEVSGLARRSPWLAVLFLLPALSLAGLPPFPGFLAKFSLVRAGLEAEQYVGVAVAIAVSLFTLVSMVKIWVAAFWGEASPSSMASPGGVVTRGLLRHHRLMATSTAVMVVGIVALAVAAGPFFEFATEAAAQLLDITSYVSAVRSP
jgi:multicomponent Na+:H+ antiporter subunit D